MNYNMGEISCPFCDAKLTDNIKIDVPCDKIIIK